MKKKAITISIICVILFLISYKLISNFIINESFINRYLEGIYEENKIKKLLVLNFFEPYVAHYNYGNLLYKINFPELAIEKYEKALKTAPKQKRCNVYINISLSKVKLALEEKTLESRKSALKKAREVLYQEECAVEGIEEGKSEEAETLEKEIKRLEEQKEESSTKPTPEDQGEPAKPEEIEDELSERNKGGKEERNKSEKDRNNINNYSYYGGKRW